MVEKVKILPTWLRMVNLVGGMIYIVFSISILANLDLVAADMPFFIKSNILLLGLLKLANLYYHRFTSKILVVFNVIIGVGALVASIFLFFIVSLEVSVLYQIVAGVLAVQGFFRLVSAMSNKIISKWAKFLNYIVGLAALVIGVCIFIIPSLAILTVIVLLAIVFILSGLSRILMAFRGYVKPNVVKRDSRRY